MLFSRSNIEKWHTSGGATQVAIYESPTEIVLLPIDTSEVVPLDVWLNSTGGVGLLVKE